MGFLDEFKRLAHPYEDEDDEEFEDDYEPSPRPVERRERERSVRSEPSYTSPAMDELEARRSNKVVNIRAATQLQVVLVKPERFENASEIADHLREKRTVVLNLESTKWPTPMRARSKRWPSPLTSSPPTTWTSWGT